MRDWYTPEELAELRSQKPCPYWQDMNHTGWCVDKWWAGGAVYSILHAVGFSAGMVLLGLIVVSAAKVKLLQPVVKMIQSSRQQMKALENSRWRTRRRRRRRR